MKLRSLVFSSALITALASVVHADEKKAVGSGPNPFSDCGIGAALFSSNKVLAVTSNIIWDVGTTALTSATASPETCSGKNVTAARFILDSYNSLAEETARGSGEHLTTLMNILEVDQDKQASLIVAVRSQMAEAVASTEYNSADKIQKSSLFYAGVMSVVDPS